MRIGNISIKNFRSFRDVDVRLSPYTSLIGPNGGGKSTILCALNIFFRETENSPTDLCNLDAEDFHSRNIDDPVEITVTFIDLNEAAQRDFADYYRQGKLVITAKAVFNKDTGVAPVKQFGQRNGMEAFKSFFEFYNDGKKVDELKAEYEGIRAQFPDLGKPGSKDAMWKALRGYEESRPGECKLLPSGDQFYGFSKGENLLLRYVQWVYVPAVKDATKEDIEGKSTALGLRRSPELTRFC